jgi:hypothetical protein
MRDASLPPAAPADPRYPIGRFTRPTVIDAAALSEALFQLGELPQNLRAAVDDLDGRQLSTPYREGGWTVRQLVHHIADSHMNCYVRIKLALTEDAPTIKAYDEAAWAGLHDGEAAPIEWSLELLEAMHARLLMLLRSLKPDQWQRTFVHPENGALSLETVALLYAWHSQHHVAHITTLRAAKGW